MWFCKELSLAFLVGVGTVFYLYVNRKFSFWSRRDSPFIRPHWVFGNFGDFIRGKASLAEVTLDIYKKFKGYRFGGVWQLYAPTLFLVDPELMRTIMVRDFEVWSSRGITANFDVDPLSLNLVHLDGKDWTSVRKKLTKTFTSAKLKSMFSLFIECGEELEKYLHAVVASGEPVDAKEMAAKFTTDVIGSCVFGIRMNSLTSEEAVFRKMGKTIFHVSFTAKIKRLLQTSCTRLYKLLKLSAFSKELTEFFLKIFKETVDYREKNNVQKNDFIDLLRALKTTNETLDGELVFDDRLLAAQAFVFFAAGFETSATAIAYCLHELAVNQEIQDRLRDEVRKTKADSAGKVTWDTLKNMKYLNMVFQETLRKHPPITLSTRISVKPYRIPGTDVELPPGTQAIIPIYAVHHDPKFYPDPERFDPERFNEDVKSQRSEPWFIPFGDGPRNCIGSRFGEQQAKLGLLKVVENFRISLCEKSQNPLEHNPKARFLSPKSGVWLRLSECPH